MDVRRVRNGPWIVFHDRFSRRPSHAKGSKEPVPTVSEALSFCKARRLQVYLDVKESKGEASLARVVRASGWSGQVTLLAYQVPSLRRWRRLFPRSPLFWVTGFRAPVTPRKIAQAKRLGVTGFVCYRRWATRAAAERVHQAGLQLFVWTARTASDLKRFARTGVDGIMSELWPPPSI